MNISNFLKAGPAWLSNLLSIVLASLLLLQSSGDNLIDFFNLIDCQSCLQTTKIVLGFVAVVLSFVKAFSSTNIPVSKTGGIIMLTLLLSNY